MKLSMDLTLDFYQYNEAFWELNSDDLGTAETYGELLFFCSFLLRLFLTLGYSDASYALAMSLFEISEKILKNDLETLNFPRNVEKREFPGEKQFKAKMKCVKRKVKFNLKLQGFSFLKKDLELYVINATLLFINYFIKERATKPGYLDKLAQITKQCAQAFVSKKLNRKTEEKMALYFAGITAKADF